MKLPGCRVIRFHAQRIPAAAVLAAAIVLGAAPADAPAASLLPESLRRLQEELDQGADLEPTGAEAMSPALEGPIEADLYRLIPGDFLHLGIWGENSRHHRIRVSPEGDLIVPDIGPVHVADLSLRSAEEQVISALRPFYGRESITLRLLEPGRYRITVTGMVKQPGLAELTPMDRLSDALEAAGGLLNGGSLRRIRLTPVQRPFSARTGSPAFPLETREVDLLPWFLKGDSEANPLLSPGLAVDVPVQRQHVQVRGPVNTRFSSPGSPTIQDGIPNRPPEEPENLVEWRPGDTVGMVLAWLGGLSERSTGQGELIRQGQPPVVLDLRNPEDLETPLEAGDLLEVEYANRWVYVIGSVRLPGRYPYLPGRTALDYVAMAGGATEVGRSSGWKRILPSGEKADLDRGAVMEPGATIRVPERRTYTLASLLSPLSTATALIISVIALTR